MDHLFDENVLSPPPGLALQLLVHLFPTAAAMGHNRSALPGPGQACFGREFFRPDGAQNNIRLAARVPMAGHGLNDHATPWLNTLRGPAPLIKARDTGFARIFEVILTPMGAGG